MRFVCDRSWRWVGDRAVLAGSPHRLFRLTSAGVDVARSICVGHHVDPSLLVDRLVDAGAIHPVPADPHSGARFTISDVTVVTPQLGGVAASDGRIIVDDGSDPALVGASLRLDHNVGPAGARNAGRRLVSTPLVLFVDADVDIEELDRSHADHQRWWAALLGHFDDPRVGLVAPRVTGDDGSSLDLGPEPGRIRAGTRLSYVPGAALLVRTDAFDDVGGFDATLRVGEDVDLVWRLDQAGWRCRYEPVASVDHRPRPSRAAQLSQQVKYGSSSGPLALRHPRALAPFASGAWSAAALLALALGRPAFGAVVAVGSAGRLASGATELDRTQAWRIAGAGHLAAGRQALVAVRRAWWPLLVPFLWSRRVRRLLAVATLVPPMRLARDVAFSVGVWSSALRSRTLAPIIPRIDLGRPR